MGILDNVNILIGRKKPSDLLPKKEPEKKKKVLVVEDEEALANALGLELEDEGFDVQKASNGEIGINLVKTYKPDVVILDLLMPVMDGKTMLHHIRQIPEFKDLPVIVLTNAGEVENIRATQLYYDAASFFVKSNVSMGEIIQRVKSFL